MDCNVKDETVLHHNGTPSGYNEPVIKSDGLKNGNKQIPGIKDIIGRAVPRIGAYKSLDNSKQVVALIDDVSRFRLLLIRSIIFQQNFLK